MDKAKKAEIIAKFGKSATDTGSPEVQIALLTQRITEITDHMRSHKKDFSTRRGLMAMVNQRKRLMKYLAAENNEKYVELIKTLGIRAQK
ncbi:MAG: 30S ribosomal protein S15 [Lentisphaerae bacterium]|nr:30S ribosomal protein S15 [Lentisphaerota bacterium]